MTVGRNEASAYEALDEAVRKALDSFFGWEACDLATQADPEEVEDAESLWLAVIEDMKELSRVQRTLRRRSET